MDVWYAKATDISGKECIREDASGILGTSAKNVDATWCCEEQTRQI